MNHGTREVGVANKEFGGAKPGSGKAAEACRPAKAKTWVYSAHSVGGKYVTFTRWDERVSTPSCAGKASTVVFLELIRLFTIQGSGGAAMCIRSLHQSCIMSVTT